MLWERQTSAMFYVALQAPVINRTAAGREMEERGNERGGEKEEGICEFWL